jgi:hypothetical protein
VTTPHLQPHEIADLICAELDPLMTANGFLAGQSGVGADDVGIVYCTPHDEFRRRFPALAPAIQYGDTGACTDLNIYAGTGPSGRLYDIRFDGISLAELLAEEGVGFAGEAETIAGVPVQAGAIRLRMVLERMLARHAVV